MIKTIVAIVTLLVALLFADIATQGGEDKSSHDITQMDTFPSILSDVQDSTRELKVKVLDVGQGDAILIETGQETILMDTSDTDEQEQLRRELDKAQVQSIDKLILTHPHADHIGGAKLILDTYPVKAVYDNGEPTTTKLYRNYLKTVKNKGVTYNQLKAGDVLDLGNGVKLTVLSPTGEMVEMGGEKNGKKNLNINSIVARLTYGNFSMLFTGDAEDITEEGILVRYRVKELQSDVLKVAHHGSRTSSTDAWMQATQPKLALISCGAGNDYGHPHKEIVQRLKKYQVEVHRTDTEGTLTVLSNGQEYSLQTEK